MRIRKIAGWIPLAALIGLVCGAGALGAVEASDVTTASSSETSPVGVILTATAEARTADYTATFIATSTNPLLRSSSTTIAQVNFRTGDSMMSTTEHSLERQRSNGGPIQVQAETNTQVERQVDGQQYFLLFGDNWERAQELPGETNKGVLAAFGPIYVGLLTMAPRHLALQTLGSTRLNGVAVTAYRVEPTIRLNACSGGLQFGQPVQTEIWVDAQRRLRAIRTSVTYLSKPPTHLPASFTSQFGPFPTGRVTMTTELHITSLGSPVHVVAPTLTHISYASSTGSFAIRSCPKGTG